MTIRQLRGVLCLALIILLASGFLWSAAVAADVEETVENIRKIKKILSRHHSQAGFPGAVIAYVFDDGDSGAVAIGVSDREYDKPMTPADRMLSGSIGKTYVAALTLQLVAEGKLSLDDKVSTWLGDTPWFPQLQNHEDITVRMLLNHTSGIPEYVRDPEFGRAVAENPDKVWSAEDRISFILDQEPLFPAGESWGYADTNYIVLGAALETLLERPLYDELQERILDEYGLEDTVPADSRRIDGLIPGYADESTPFQLAGKTITDGTFAFNPQLEWTGGGLASTTMDLARWGNRLFDGDVIPQPLWSEFIDGVPAALGPNHRYGLGVIIWHGELGQCHGHSGWFPGYVSNLIYYKDHGLTLAVQFNSDSMKTRTALATILDEVAAAITTPVTR